MHVCDVYRSFKVPNNCIGAILGVGGANVRGMQESTGANIRVSSKNEVVPGTRNRFIYISGPQWSVQQAQYLCVQIITEVYKSNNGPPPMYADGDSKNNGLNKAMDNLNMDGTFTNIDNAAPDSPNQLSNELLATTTTTTTSVDQQKFEMNFYNDEN